MRKLALCVLVALMAMSVVASVAFAAPAADGFDENGWYQNTNMETLTTNDEGASVIKLAGSVPTYNRTELDLTKVNFVYLKTTAGNWAALHLIDDATIVTGSGEDWYPAGSKGGHVKLSALIQDNAMQLGNGYTASGVIGTDEGTPSGINGKYIKFAFYIGTGAEGDESYFEVNGTKVVGQGGAKLNLTRDSFANGKCYVAVQTLSPDLPIYATGINEEPNVAPEVSFLPIGLGAGNSAGFMIDKNIADIPESGYALTQANAVNNVTFNGGTIADAHAFLYVLETELNGVKIQSLGLLPENGHTFSWTVGDEIVFRKGFTAYGPTGSVIGVTSRDFAFSVVATESGNATFGQQIGLRWNGNAGNFVNLDLTAQVMFTAPIATSNVTAITVNGEPLSSVGYFNVATNTIVQILKNEGDWTWQKGDVIRLPKGFAFSSADNATYCLDADYVATYGDNGFVFEKDLGNDYTPVAVKKMEIGHYFADENKYGMQIHFEQEVRGDIEAGADISGEAWFNKYIKVNGKTLAEIKAINIGTEENPVYPNVSAIFEGANFITLWIDGRAGVIEPGNNALGDGNKVSILAGIRFPSGYETTEDKSFEWTNPAWHETVVLKGLEFDVGDGGTVEGALEGGNGSPFINIPSVALGELTKEGFPIDMVESTTKYVMFNGQTFEQMVKGELTIIQYSNANVLQIKTNHSVWSVGDKLVLMKGMKFYNDIPNKASASAVAELAHYYIFECVSVETNGAAKFNVTVTDSYEADDDIALEYAGVKQLISDAARNAYGFQLHFSKNVRGTAYDKFADITNEDWIKASVKINGKTIDELLAAKDADGNEIPNAVQVLFENDKYIAFYVSKAIPVEAGGIAYADGTLADKITLTLADGFTLPRGGAIAMGISYKYEFGGWCRDIDLSGLEFSEIKVVSVENPVSVDDDGNIAFKVKFDKNITEGPYLHINAGSEWLSGVELGYSAATLDYLASYGFIRDCLTKIRYNGMTVEELMDTEKNASFRPINVIMVHYKANEIQLVFRARSVNTTDGTFGEPGKYAINVSDPDPDWTISFAEGFTVPSLGKTSKEYTFKYNAGTKKFEEVIKEDVITSVEFDEVYYDGTKIENGGTLELTGVTSLDKNVFTVTFRNGVEAPWELTGGDSLVVGENTVTITASTTDGSGTTATFTFTVKVTESAKTDSAQSGGCGGCKGSSDIASVGLALVTMLAAACFVRMKRGN